MKKKIEEINAYFKAKILAGEFEFIDSSIAQVALNIDGYRIPLYYPGDGSIESLSEKAVLYIKFTEEESNTIRGLVDLSIKKFERTEKIKQLEKLKKELEND